ncbi:hypothetical protein JCM8097_000950 [Rhodosporidiobolus ruineniae]
MGNNQSSQQGGGAGQSGQPSSGRSSRHPSPRTRTVNLPSTSTSNATARGTTSSSSATGARRKKSIDMPDVNPPPSRSSSTRTSRGPPPARSSSGSSTLTPGGAGGSMHRKGSDRVPVVDEHDDEPDMDPRLGGGSLRGALQGKAEHVVYGPRREDDEAAILEDPPTLAPGTIKSKPVAPAPPPATAMAIPGAGADGSGSGTRTPAGGLVSGRDGSLTNAGMGAIGASAMPGLGGVDPDDTMHPGFSTAPRLTSAVLMSQDSMPVLNSPAREELPGDSPFYPGGATPAEGATTPTQEKTAAAAAAGGGGNGQSELQQGDLAATLSGLGPSHPAGFRTVVTPQTSFAGAASSIFAPSPSGSPSVTGTTSSGGPTPTVPTSHLLPPYTASPSPPSTAPSDTVLAPALPTSDLPLPAAHIPSGTSVIASPAASRGSTPVAPSPAVLLPPAVFNAPVAAIPIPLLSVPSPSVAQTLLAAAVDLGAGESGVPTLIKWKNEDGQVPADPEKGVEARGPNQVFVTGTFAQGWKIKIELRKTDPSDFSALISLPPGPHRLKFIVDAEWKASKHLPVATDADGNLINYLQVNSTLPAGALAAAPTTTPAQVPTPTSRPLPPAAGGQQSQPLHGFNTFSHLFWPEGSEDPSAAANGGNGGTGAGGGGYGHVDWWAADGDDDASQWTQEIPPELVAWGEWEAQRDAIEADFYARYPSGQPPADADWPEVPPPPVSASVAPPTLPAQLEKGPLNHAAYVTQGSGDDNSILPKPDHSVINHLAASPIKGGFLSVGVTTRYKRKFVTIVYYKALAR